MGPLPTAPAREAQPSTAAAPVPYAAEGKSWLAAALLAWFLGVFGVDRFYLGYIGLGVIKLITCGGCWIWALIDFILIVAGVMRDAQGNELRQTPNDWIIVLVIVVATIVLNIFYGFFSIIAGMMQRGMPIFKPIP
jgi:type II secretory pathway component PulF